MVIRVPLVDQRGRAWVTGQLDATTYFDQVAAEARERATGHVAERMEQLHREDAERRRATWKRRFGWPRATA